MLQVLLGLLKGTMPWKTDDWQEISISLVIGRMFELPEKLLPRGPAHVLLAGATATKDAPALAISEG
jgi:hypothetical protein